MIVLHCIMIMQTKCFLLTKKYSEVHLGNAIQPKYALLQARLSLYNLDLVECNLTKVHSHKHT